MYRLLFGILAVLTLAEADVAEHDLQWRQHARRRLGGNNCVDESVTQELSEHADPDADISLVIALSLEPGSGSKERCRIEGLQLCIRLGAEAESNSLYCNDHYNYVGPDVIDTDSTVSCLRFVYGVKAGEREAVEAIVAEADSDLVVAVSNVDTEITVDACITESTNSAWGLGFLDRHSPSSSGSNAFEYDSSDGIGTVAYVVDTGVSHHNEFGNRLIGGINLWAGNSDYSDRQGHGTHVAGTIASSAYGVAKGASIYAINIFGSSTVTNTWLITSAIQHAYQRAVQNGEKAVINLSLGGSANSAEDDLVNAAVSNGVSVVSAAGNAGINACDYSPARASGGLAVAASNSGGGWVSFSNYGQCVDVIAPGQNILSTIPGNNAVYMSGTSMAAPHVAGVICQIMSRLQISNPTDVYPYITGSSPIYAAENQISGIPSRTGRDETRNLVIQSPCIPPGPVNECQMVANLCGEGTCTDRDDGYTCTCPAGYTGDNCEFYDECTLLSPCQNGATCTNLVNGYECDCLPGFSGTDCETHNFPPVGCTCVEQFHSSWGLIDDHCERWGNHPVWCYVADDDSCTAKTPSLSISGAHWVDCEQTTGPPPTQIPTQTSIPTDEPTFRPTNSPTPSPTAAPTPPTRTPTAQPTPTPTFNPTKAPTQPTAAPTRQPTATPTRRPTAIPTRDPTFTPTFPPAPTRDPTLSPTSAPTARAPSRDPTFPPTSAPTAQDTVCGPVNCNGGVCVDDSSAPNGYTCQECPLDRDGEHCEIQYIPPTGCVCVSHPSSDFGDFDTCHTDSQYEPWCYVEGSCEKHPSTVVNGAHWAMCDIKPETGTSSTLPPALQVKICEYYSWWGWERRCCMKGVGDHPRSGFSEDGSCPRNNHVRYVEVPHGARAIVYDGRNLNGYSYVVDGSDGERWQYFSRWISSMRVELTD